MANPHNRRPMYFRASEPTDTGVSKIADHIFQWDLNNGTPQEIQAGLAAMPPQEIPGEFAVWSDTYSLGYVNDMADAAPIFFSDGNLGDDEKLKVINHIARRLGQPEFDHVEYGKAWIFTEPKVWATQEGVVLPQTDLIIHYDVAAPGGYDATNMVIKNLSPAANASVMDANVLGGTPDTSDGFVGFDGVSTYAEVQEPFSDVWNYIDFDTNKSFTLYGAFYSAGRQTAAVTFGKFGGYRLFTRRSWDSPNAAFGIADIIDDGDSNDFFNMYAVTSDFGAQEGVWFQAGLRVTYNDSDGTSSVEFLYNGKSMQTWLNEYSGPYESDGVTPAENGPARAAYFMGTSTVGNFDWNVEPTAGWKQGPFRMGRHSYDNYYGANKVSYFAHYSRAINDEELLSLHDYHQTRFE